MAAVTTFKSVLIPVPIRDVDTDMILPANYLTNITRDGYKDGLFRRLRDNDPNFSFNLSKFQDAKIVVGDDNFGCGSSREHAVWALTNWGIKAVIAPSFADIFSGNSGKNGLILVRLPQADVDKLMHAAQAGSYEVEVNLEKQVVTLPDGGTHSFPFDPFTKHCIMSGLDDIEYIRSHASEVKAFQEKRSQNFFFSAIQPNR